LERSGSDIHRPSLAPLAQHAPVYRLAGVFGADTRDVIAQVFSQGARFHLATAPFALFHDRSTLGARALKRDQSRVCLVALAQGALGMDAREVDAPTCTLTGRAVVALDATLAGASRTGFRAVGFHG
jgi:hypothetical protein